MVLLVTNFKRLGVHPSDDNEGEIADLAGELGFFSPHSWWPLVVALSACTMGLGLVLGWWVDRYWNRRTYCGYSRLDS
ncbi:MAG: cytochrome c oxidase subunit 4 [Actinomycetota bacterium]